MELRRREVETGSEVLCAVVPYTSVHMMFDFILSYELITDSFYPDTDVGGSARRSVAGSYS